jgi:hypothetical protein
MIAGESTDLSAFRQPCSRAGAGDWSSHYLLNLGRVHLWQLTFEPPIHSQFDLWLELPAFRSRFCEIPNGRIADREPLCDSLRLVSYVHLSVCSLWPYERPGR